jgi:hypothetical protein
MAAGTLKALDTFLPEYEFSERHAIRVHASAERIDEAIRSLAAADIPLVGALLRLRALGRKPRRGPIIESARLLDESPGEGVVLGLSGQFWRLRGNLGGHGPDVCEAVFDFRIDGDRVTTETRVHVEDPHARRKFARYWRIIRPFSGLTRILFLREIKRTAESV